MPSSPPENESAAIDTLATQRGRAVSAFLLDHHALLPALASRLGGGDAVFESAIRGDSMAPAIPGGSRLRVRLRAEQPGSPGDIVFFLSHGGFMVHRIVYCHSPSLAVGYLLTIGDNCLVPDPPVTQDRILGTVIAVKTSTGWRPPGPPLIPTFYHRVIRHISSAATIASLRLSVSAACRVVAVLAKLESALRPRVGRLRRLNRFVLLRTGLAGILRPLARLRDRRRHRGLRKLDINVARINALLPQARRENVACAISAVLADTDLLDYFKNLGAYDGRHRDLPPDVPALNDIYPPNLAVLDFLANYLTNPEKEVLLDFGCGIGGLLVYAHDLGLTRVHGFDNWRNLARSTAGKFLRRFGLDESVLANPEDLENIPATIVTCVGFHRPMVLLAEASHLLAKPSVKYVLVDQLGMPAELPGFHRTCEYAGLLTIYRKSPPI